MKRRERGKTVRGIQKNRRRGALARKLLAWYDKNKRNLPWRALPGQTPDPYRVWLSEIMLQQTTVTAVAPYFQRFLERWPDVRALAAAGLDDVLREWQGLGYYARARNLHACARAVAIDLNGCFPETEAALLALPGVGAYTAGAIAAIAFGAKAVAVDGNAERVLARLFAVPTSLPAAKPELRACALQLLPAGRPGDFAQALMDLGAMICTPRAPACSLCPWCGDCAAHAKGIEESLPRRSAKPARPLRRGVAFFLTRADGAIWLRRRQDSGLLGGMMEVASTPWRGELWSEEEAVSLAPAAAKWRSLPGVVRHGFTHFELELRVLAGEAGRHPPPGGRWVHPVDLASAALPTLMRKVIEHASAHGRAVPSGTSPRAKRKTRPDRSRNGRDIVRGGVA